MRVLMTVGSRHGATREIGVEIAEVLERAGHVVDQIEPDDVTSIDEYDAVVLGSSVYVGRLAESVRALADRFEAQLAEVALWLFWSGPIGTPPRPSEQPDDVGYLVRRLAPVGQHEFGGRVERSELGMAERALVAMVGAKPGDYRDFDEIDRWAESIAVKLHSRPTSRR